MISRPCTRQNSTTAAVAQLNPAQPGSPKLGLGGAGAAPPRPAPCRREPPLPGGEVGRGDAEAGFAGLAAPARVDERGDAQAGDRFVSPAVRPGQFVDTLAPRQRLAD